MSKISIDDIKNLRASTGVGMTKCKDALVASEGDLQKAMDYLRKQGMSAATAVKKAGRVADEGSIMWAENAECLALVELNCETDFVAKNPKFQTFLKQLCEKAIKLKPENIDQFLTQRYDDEHSVEDYRNLNIQLLGENIQIARVLVIPKQADSSYGFYSHMNGKMVAVVALCGSADLQDLAAELAMQVVAERPQFISPESVPAAILAKESEIARAQVSGKPEHIMDKIVQGKLNAFYNQVCLVKQKYIQDSDITVEQHIKKAGDGIAVANFWCWCLGS